MRILHLNQHGTYRGGVEGYILDVAQALKSNGHESRLVYFEDHHQGEKPLFNTDLPGCITRDNWKRQLKFILDDFQPDVAYIHAVYEPSIVRWIPGLLPTVAYIHSPYVVCPGYGLFLRRKKKPCPYSAGPACLMRAQTERCCFGRNPVRHVTRLREVNDFIKIYRELPLLVSSRFMRDLLLRNGLAVSEETILAPVLLRDVSVSPPQSTELIRILFAGRLIPEKGLIYLIRSLAQVDSNWELLVAGDGPERRRLESEVTRLDLANQIRFLGWCNDAEMAHLYDQCAMVVVPSLWPEPFGRVGPEAAAHGRPTVAFEVGGVRDWLEDGITGLLVPSGDTAALTSSLQKLFDNPSLRIDLGQRAHELALRRWHESKHIQQLVGYFNDVIMHWKTTS